MPFDWKEEFEFFPGIGQMDFFRVTADSLLGLLLSLSFHITKICAIPSELAMHLSIRNLLLTLSARDQSSMGSMITCGLSIGI